MRLFCGDVGGAAFHQEHLVKCLSAGVSAKLLHSVVWSVGVA